MHGNGPDLKSLAGAHSDRHAEARAWGPAGGFHATHPGHRAAAQRRNRRSKNRAPKKAQSILLNVGLRYG